jgi:hypothetical protein
MQVAREYRQLAFGARYCLNAARADGAAQDPHFLARAPQHTIETVKPLYPEKRTVHWHSYVGRPTEALAPVLFKAKTTRVASGSLPLHPPHAVYPS